MDKKLQKIPSSIMRLSIVLFYLFLSISCAHIEPIRYGTVQDAETGMPIKGAVVHIDIISGLPLPPVGYTEVEDSYETLTDEKGTYRLPLKLAGRIPLLEYTDDNTISIFKAGYFEACIPDPSLYNRINLHRIKYHLDYLNYKKYAQQGDMNPTYMDKNPESFAQYKAELSNMASMQMHATGKESVFLEIPGAKLTKLFRRSTQKKRGRRDRYIPYTYRINELVYYVFDDVSQKWFAFDLQGNIKAFDNELLYEYMFFSSDHFWGHDAIYANPAKFYLPSDYVHKARHFTPQKGDISALTGDTYEYLTIEQNRQSLCFYINYEDIRHGCISMNEILQLTDTKHNNESELLFIALGAKGYYHFMISKEIDTYRLYRVHNPSSPWNSKPIFRVEPLSPVIPTDKIIVAFDSDPRNLFIAFSDNVVDFQII